MAEVPAVNTAAPAAAPAAPVTAQGTTQGAPALSSVAPAAAVPVTAPPATAAANVVAPNNTAPVATGRKPLLGAAIPLWDALLSEGKVNLVEEKVYAELAALKEDEQVEAIKGFTESTQVIRNQSAFLVGIIRRIQRRSGEKQVSRSELAQSVQDKLKEIEDAGKLDGFAFDKKQLSVFSEFSEPKQLEILSTFLSADHSTIKNGVGFLGGIIKRYYRTEGMDDKNRVMPEAVKALLEDAYKNNPHLSEGDLDSRCLNVLKVFPPNLSKQLVEDFLRSELAEVKSKSGFFFGIVKRFERKYNISASGRQEHRRDGYDSYDRSRGRDYGRDRDYRDRDYRGRGGGGYRDRSYGSRDYGSRDYGARGYGSRDYGARDYGYSGYGAPGSYGGQYPYQNNDPYGRAPPPQQQAPYGNPGYAPNPGYYRPAYGSGGGGAASGGSRDFDYREAGARY